MEKIIVTAFGKTVKSSDMKRTFMEVCIFSEEDLPYHIGAVLKSNEIISIARIRDKEMASLVYSQLRGIINHPEKCSDVHNINVEMESLKRLIDVLDAVAQPGDYVRETLLMGALQQLMDGIAPPDSETRK